MPKQSPSPKPTSSKNNTALDSDNLGSSSSNASSETVCGVCGEKTKSKHFGAYSCLSCKVFFRRSILESRIYFCEGNEDCVIEKEQRTACKVCRFAKCLKIGMDPKMLHSTRKGPSKKQKDPPPSEAPLLHNPCVDRSQVDALILFDRYLCDRVDPPTASVGRNAAAEAIELPFLIAFRQPSLVHPRTKMPVSIDRLCTTNDMVDHLQRGFVLYADWLNEFHDFLALPEHVQFVLAKAGFPHYNLHLCAWRTSLIGCPGVSLLNGALHPLDHQLMCVPDPKGIISFLMRNLVEGLKSLKVDEAEITLLKIIDFFTEESLDLNEAESNRVREKRDKYIGILTKYIQSKHPRLVEVDAACRVGELMLFLASITQCAYMASDTVGYWEAMGFIPFGSLICDAVKQPSTPSSSGALKPSTSQESSQ